MLNKVQSSSSSRIMPSVFMRRLSLPSMLDARSSTEVDMSDNIVHLSLDIESANLGRPSERRSPVGLGAYVPVRVPKGANVHCCLDFDTSFLVLPFKAWCT